MGKAKFRGGPYRTSRKNTGSIPRLFWGRRATGCPWLAGKIRYARQRRRLTQQDLAAVLGVPRSRIALWETGRRAVTEADYARLYEALPLQHVKIEIARSLQHADPVVRFRHKGKLESGGR